VKNFGILWGIYYLYAVIQLVEKNMDSFSGTIHAKTDVKGRVFVPATFRKILQSSGEMRLKLRKDVYKDCLILCLESTWKFMMDDLGQRLNPWNEEEQELFRSISADVDNVELDSSGRILIPKDYLRRANISNSVCFVGMNNQIEIWSSDKLNKILLNTDDLKSHVRKFLSNSKRVNERSEE